ncbi:MAG: hypothetical protein ACK5Q5_23820 [Planctomycetaceae bacterium]
MRWYGLSLVALGLIAFSNLSLDGDDRIEDKAHKEHNAAASDHAAADAEHRGWELKIRTMRAEHLEALAVLKRMEAEILEHDAEMERQLVHILQHEQEMHAHAHEIAEHEASGSGKEHDALVRKHREMQTTHGELGQALEKSMEHHQQYIREIRELGEKHRHGHK